MGKWNQRWQPRKKYRQETAEFHVPQHHWQQFQSSSAEWKSNVPSWEKEFCIKVGSVPWVKVMYTKECMHYHDSVLKWNDSACEEAFNNAKERFRAGIYGLPCDIPVADPDIHIDEINWSPDIDPKLIGDVDEEYFNPEERRKNKVETAEPVPHNYNPWEGKDFKATNALKDVARGWNQWDASIVDSKNINNNTENPWEQSNTHVKKFVNGNGWVSSGDKSWGWKLGQVHDERSKNFDSQWGCGWQNVGSGIEKGWSSSHDWSRGGWDRWEAAGGSTLVHEWNKDSHDWSCGGWDGWEAAGGSNSMHEWNKDNIGVKGGWEDCWDREWGNKKECFDSNESGGAWGGQWQKREGSHQYLLRHKSSQFQGDGCTGNQQWREKNDPKRVTIG